MTRLTSDPGNDVNPVWSPDGRWIMFSSDRGGSGPQLLPDTRGRHGGEERVLQSSTAMIPNSWSRDGLSRLSEQTRLQTGGTSALNRRGAPPLRQVAIRSGRGPGLAGWPVAGLYISGRRSRHGNMGTCDECGTSTCKASPCPVGKVRVSTNGATSPRWSRDGRELFFYAGDGRLMAVPVTSDGAALEVGTATALFEPVTPRRRCSADWFQAAVRRRERWTIPAQRARRTRQRPVVHCRRQLGCRP